MVGRLRAAKHVPSSGVRALLRCATRPIARRVCQPYHKRYGRVHRQGHERRAATDVQLRDDSRPHQSMCAAVNAWQ
eukprot:24967-Chlamydomonas_euryale.AAC.1